MHVLLHFRVHARLSPEGHEDQPERIESRNESGNQAYEPEDVGAALEVHTQYLVLRPESRKGNYAGERQSRRHQRPELARIFPPQPPIFLMSCSPETACITEPDPRNSSALKKACVTKWKMAATQAPTPRAMNI